MYDCNCGRCRGKEDLRFAYAREYIFCENCEVRIDADNDVYFTTRDGTFCSEDCIFAFYNVTVIEG